MNKKIYLTCLTALLASSIAQAENKEESYTEISTVKDGDVVEKSVKTETVNDPKGLGNKTWSNDKASAKYNKNGEVEVTSEHKSVDEHGTAHKGTTKSETEVKSDGKIVTTTTDTSVTDPKGLMNKKSVTTEKKVEEKPDGTIDISVKTK